MNPDAVPQTTIARLPIYLRCLLQAQAAQMPVVNSGTIAKMMGSNPAQVRKDFSYLGELGTRGIGYDVASLISHISRRLGLTATRRVAIVGFGRLGQALQSYGGFHERGFEVVAVFDTDPAKVGVGFGQLVVRHIDEMRTTLPEEGAEIVIIATPAGVAQRMADAAVASGVKAILNFAPISIEVPEEVAVRHVEMAVELQILSFHLANKAE